ncbi:hypothetical protein ABFT80_06080 [Mesorhizobium sp. SB112]|uniref:hypothetical protein n=1 Tax=Mesorhizobium sp. SB112 TaxID=3151853 RepID=UPI0032640076
MSRPTSQSKATAVQVLLTDAIEAGERARARVVHTTNSLQRQMQEIHGGIWRVKIDHKSRFVMIVAGPDRKDVQS